MLKKFTKTLPNQFGKCIYLSLAKYEKATEYHEKDLKTAIQFGNQDGEGGAYGSPGDAYNSLGDFRRAIEYHKKNT